jgi:ankyrin repeat protein
MCFLLVASCGQATSEDVAAFADPRAQELAEAVLADDVPQIAALAAAGADVDAISDKGRSPLYLACRENRLAAMQALLQAGADPWLGLPPQGEVTVPWIVVSKQSLPQLKLLLDQGLDPNHAMPANDVSLLHLAAFDGWFEGVDLLLDRGADINYKPSRFESTVENAIAGGRYDMALHLFERGYNRDIEELAWSTASSFVDDASEPDRQRFIVLLRTKGVQYPPVRPSADAAPGKPETDEGQKQSPPVNR